MPGYQFPPDFTQDPFTGQAPYDPMAPVREALRPRSPQTSDAPSPLAGAIGRNDVFSDRQRLLEQMMSEAQALRGTRMPGGRSQGNVFVASPLEAITAGFERGVGAQQQKSVLAQQKGLVDGAEKDSTAIAEEQMRLLQQQQLEDLLNQIRASQQPTPQQPYPFSYGGM